MYNQPHRWRIIEKHMMIFMLDSEDVIFFLLVVTFQENFYLIVFISFSLLIGILYLVRHNSHAFI